MDSIQERELRKDLEEGETERMKERNVVAEASGEESQCSEGPKEGIRVTTENRNINREIEREVGLCGWVVIFYSM